MLRNSVQFDARVDVEERNAVGAGIVGRPPEREHALFVFDGGSDDGAVVGAADVDDDIVAAADADGLADVLDGLPSSGRVWYSSWSLTFSM